MNTLASLAKSRFPIAALIVFLASAFLPLSGCNILAPEGASWIFHIASSDPHSLAKQLADSLSSKTGRTVQTVRLVNGAEIFTLASGEPDSSFTKFCYGPSRDYLIAVDVCEEERTGGFHQNCCAVSVVRSRGLEDEKLRQLLVQIEEVLRAHGLEWEFERKITWMKLS